MQNENITGFRFEEIGYVEDWFNDQRSILFRNHPLTFFNHGIRHREQFIRSIRRSL